jgi:hypothetical protein
MKHFIGPTNPMRAQFEPRAAYHARHFAWSFEGGVGTLTLNRPERKNPLTFDSYAELRDLFHELRYATDVKAVVVTGAGGNFCSGGDVHEIIGPLTKMTHARAAGVHPHDRRPGQGHAQLPAAHHRRHRRRLRRRRRHDGAGLRPALRHRAQPRPPSCSPASGWPAPTWAPARCCRA